MRFSYPVFCGIWLTVWVGGLDWRFSACGKWLTGGGLGSNLTPLSISSSGTETSVDAPAVNDGTSQAFTPKTGLIGVWTLQKHFVAV